MVKSKFKIKKVFIIWTCVVAVALTACAVYALNSWDTGYRVNNGSTGTVDLSSHGDASCRECKKVTDASGKDIFVPTKSCAEWNTFKANLPAGVTISNCFTCGDLLVDERDGRSYPTVSVGSQCWMAKNLNYGTYMVGEGGSSINHQDPTNTLSTRKYCLNDNPGNCATYGGFYQWHEAVGLNKNCDDVDCSAQINTYPWQGICPAGWHIPSDIENPGDPDLNNDWYALENVLKTVGQTCTPDRNPNNNDIWMCNGAGTKMKTVGVNELNMEILGSIQEDNVGWNNFGVDGHFWSSAATSNPTDTNRTWSRTLEPGKTGVLRKAKEKNRGFNVRCVKN